MSYRRADFLCVLAQLLDHLSGEAQATHLALEAVKGDEAMQVKQIMTREVEQVETKTPLIEAAQRMKSYDIGMLPVCDGQSLVGMITDRDITVRATANGFDPQKTMCREVMTPRVVCCFEDQQLGSAVKLMQDNKIRRLPVINRDRRLVGVVSIGDIALGGDDGNLIYASMQKISLPDAPKPLPGQKRE
jgi:CBS domain-containing protein